VPQYYVIRIASLIYEAMYRSHIEIIMLRKYNRALNYLFYHN